MKHKILDGLQSLVMRLGYGVGGGDRQLSDAHYIDQRDEIDYVGLEAMYKVSWLAGVAIDVIASDMTREGIEILGSLDSEQRTKIEKTMTRSGAWNAITKLIKYGRLYGGAGAVIQVEGQRLDSPLSPKSVGLGMFKGLSVYSRRMLEPALEMGLVQFGPCAGTPNFYRIYWNAEEKTSESNELVHYSRVLRFTGFDLPEYLAQTNLYWGGSVFSRMKDRIISYDVATLSAIEMMKRAYLRTVKIDGLREGLASDDEFENSLLSMFGNLSLFQNNAKITLLDKEDEFQTDSYSFGGIAEMLVQFGQQIAGAIGAPATKVFGQSPAGMNSTGEHDLKNYYDTIKAQQEEKLREPLYRLLSVVHSSVIGVAPDDDFDFNFRPLWQMNESEKASISATQTQAILSAFDAGLIDAETAMSELKNLSEITGVFDSITQEKIDEAKLDLPSIGELDLAGPEVEQNAV